MEKKRYRYILPKPLVNETTPTNEINHNQASRSKSSPDNQMGEAKLPGVFHILFETDPRKISGPPKGGANSTIYPFTDADRKKLPIKQESEKADENDQKEDETMKKDQVIVDLDSIGNVVSCHQVWLKVKNNKRRLANQEEFKCDKCSKQCVVCGRSFANITTLKKHLSIHNGKQESASTN